MKRIPFALASLALAPLGLAAAASAALAAGAIAFSADVTVPHGRTVLLYGARGPACTDPAPSWAALKAGLPKSTLGTFSDGGAIRRKSQACGEAAARGIRFTAHRKGTEVLDFAGDRITVTVE